MPSNSGKVRKRYIAFKIVAPRTISRKEFVAAIREGIPDKNTWDRVRPWLTIFEHNEGILRCTHTSKNEAIMLLKAIKLMGKEKMPIRVETLGTSGTIKSAVKKYLGKGDL